MTTIPGVGQVSTSTLKTTKNATLDHEAFLRLFVEQLKHQDPTAPLDATQSLAQLATFSQVEQGVATNKKLDTLLAAQSLSQANSLIGRTLTSADGSVSGQVVSVQVTADGALATLADGRTIVAGTGVLVS